MFHKEHSEKKNVFVNNMKSDKVDKKKESKTEVRGGHATSTRNAHPFQGKGRFAPPHVSTKISAYDRIVQLVTNDRSRAEDPEVISQQQESGASFVQKKRIHMSV